MTTNDSQSPFSPPTLPGFDAPELTAIPTHHIVQMTRKQSSNSKSPSWVCNCDDGETAMWVFDHALPERNNYPLFREYHAEMGRMNLNDVIDWSEYPIAVVARIEKGKDGRDHFKPTAVLPRPAGARADLPRAVHDLQAEQAKLKRLTWEHARARAASLVIAPNAVIVDVETTDRVKTSTLLSITILNMEGEILLSSYVRPMRPTINRALHVNGITPDLYMHAPTLAELHEQIQSILGDRVVICYNADFDLSVLDYNCIENDLPPFAWLGEACAMLLFAKYEGTWDHKRQEWKWAKLINAAARFGIEATDAHTATGDTRTTLALLNEMAIGAPLKPEFPF